MLLYKFQLPWHIGNVVVLNIYFVRPTFDGNRQYLLFCQLLIFAEYANARAHQGNKRGSTLQLNTTLSVPLFGGCVAGIRNAPHLLNARLSMFFSDESAEVNKMSDETPPETLQA